jgi:hypothetical protein
MPSRRIPLRCPGRLLFALAAVLAALLFPAAAQALKLRIENETAEDVYVTVTGGDFDVPGMADDVPKPLGEVPDPLTINTLDSGRIYLSYGVPIHESELGELFRSSTRFDWAELTVKPSSSDKANLTAVEQAGIGMRLDTYDAAKHHLEELGSANSNTIFAAMQGIPGGPAATVRNGSNEIVRVLSPQKTASYPDLADAYPDLGDYVRSMSGRTIRLHTAFFGAPFVTSVYSGAFAGDGSITLNGTTNPPGEAPAQISFQGADLIDDIYTGDNTPNTVEGTIRRDVLSGFSAGYWGGRYGNDAIDFCANPNTTAQGTWCPEGFNRPAFGDARASLSPFPTCEQYAAVIAKYADTYGNPYSDASGKVQISLDQPGTGGEVDTLKLTILPDSGSAQPVSGGNANCGAATSGPPNSAPTASSPPVAVPATIAPPRVAVRARPLRRARLRRGKLRVARVACSSACGRIRAVVRRGKRVLARKLIKRAGRKRLVVVHPTRRGRKLLRRRRKLKARLDLWVAPAGQRPRHLHRRLLLVR